VQQWREGWHQVAEGSESLEHRNKGTRSTSGGSITTTMECHNVVLALSTQVQALPFLA